MSESIKDDTSSIAESISSDNSINSINSIDKPRKGWFSIGASYARKASKYFNQGSVMLRRDVLAPSWAMVTHWTGIFEPHGHMKGYHLSVHNASMKLRREMLDQITRKESVEGSFIDRWCQAIMNYDFTTVIFVSLVVSISVISFFYIFTSVADDLNQKFYKEEFEAYQEKKRAKRKEKLKLRKRRRKRRSSTSGSDKVSKS